MTDKKIERIWNTVKGLNIVYGFLGTDREVYKFEDYSESDFDEKMDRLYKLQKPSELLRTRCGVCWDTVELLRDYFATMRIPHKTIYLEKWSDHPEESHTFLIANVNGQLYYPEWSFGRIRGLHTEFTDTKSVVYFVLENMRKSFYHKEQQIVAYSYNTPKSGCDISEFMTHCQKSTPILHIDHGKEKFFKEP